MGVPLLDEMLGGGLPRGYSLLVAGPSGSGKSVLALQLEASLSAIDDAGLTPKDIDGIIVYSPGTTVAEDFITNFGIADLRFSASTPMGWPPWPTPGWLCWAFPGIWP